MQCTCIFTERTNRHLYKYFYGAKTVIADCSIYGRMVRFTRSKDISCFSTAARLKIDTESSIAWPGRDANIPPSRWGKGGIAFFRQAADREKQTLEVHWIAPLGAVKDKMNDKLFFAKNGCFPENIAFRLESLIKVIQFCKNPKKLPLQDARFWQTFLFFSVPRSFQNCSFQMKKLFCANLLSFRFDDNPYFK